MFKLKFNFLIVCMVAENSVCTAVVFIWKGRKPTDCNRAEVDLLACLQWAFLIFVNSIVAEFIFIMAYL